SAPMADFPAPSRSEPHRWTVDRAAARPRLIRPRTVATPAPTAPTSARTAPTTVERTAFHVLVLVEGMNRQAATMGFLMALNPVTTTLRITPTTATTTRWSSWKAGTRPGLPPRIHFTTWTMIRTSQVRAPTSRLMTGTRSFITYHFWKAM